MLKIAALQWLILCNLASISLACESDLALDLIFLIDSSGSVYDAEYLNWQQELDFVKFIVNHSLPLDTRVALINWSGCGADILTIEECQTLQNRMKKEFGLTDYGDPNDLQSVYDRVGAMGPADLTGGYTWMNEALTMALNEFNGNSSADRSKMIIMLTDGEPFPYDAGHEPCVRSTGYVSDTLQELRKLNTQIVVIGIAVTASNWQNHLECLADDLFYASDFSVLSYLKHQVERIACNQDTTLIINEVSSNVNEQLVFVEIYNPSVPVTLTGFRLSGLINYTVTEDVEIEQGQYWVISAYDLNAINQSLCTNCSQDLLVNASSVDTTMSNAYWRVELLDTTGKTIDSVEQNLIYFPTVSAYRTNQLQYEGWDNAVGGNWKESCYDYGTPRTANQETCACVDGECKSRGDTSAYCGTFNDSAGSTYTDCVCGNDYTLNAGVCVPVSAPDCCYMFADNCPEDQVVLTWCEPQSAPFTAFRVYKDGQQFVTLSKNIREARISVNTSLPREARISTESTYSCRPRNRCVGLQTPSQSCGYSAHAAATVYTVTAIYQSTPLIESFAQSCNLTQPTLAPTSHPTSSPTNKPTASPTAQTTAPTAIPTLSTLSPTTATPTLSTLSPTTATPTSSPTTSDPTTSEPSVSPTTASPTTASPTDATLLPTPAPQTTESPTSQPTSEPTDAPTMEPTSESTTGNPTAEPTEDVVNASSSYVFSYFLLLSSVSFVFVCY